MPIKIDPRKISISLAAVRTLATMQGGHFYRSGMDLPINVRSSNIMKRTIIHCEIPFDHRVEPGVFEELKRREYVGLHVESVDFDQWCMTSKAKKLLKDLGLRNREGRPVLESVSWLVENPAYAAHH